MRLLTTRYNSGAFNMAMLILRLGFGILIAHHGYDKIMHFSEYQNTFMNFMGLGSKISLSLDIFAEFFCGILVILGLFTRLACIPLIIGLCVAFFKATNEDVFGQGELAILYIAAFLTLLFAGPGRVSIDSVISK